MADKTEYEAAYEAAYSNAATTGFDPDGAGQFAVVPSGYHVESLEQFQAQPNRIRARRRFVEVDSLIRYAIDFDKTNARAEANYKEGTIKVTFDASHADQPSFEEHTATFHAEIHPKLEAWLTASGRPMGQVMFGEFLEGRAVDVVQPDAATIMEMVMTFDAIKKVTFKQSTRLSDGQRQFQYIEENETRGAVTLPDRIMIRTPIYRGQEAQDVVFLLRYRIEDGSLRFTILMHDKDEVMRAAFEQSVTTFASETDTQPFVTG